MEPLKFIAYGLGAFGTGSTLDEAVGNYRTASGNKRCMVWMWANNDALPTKAWGHAMGIRWEGSEDRPVLVHDGRLAKDRKRSPVAIGTPLM